MHKYKDLKVWQKSLDLVVEVYKATADYPKDERFGLISQTQRCAVSIPSNIAEGAGRNSDKEFVQFLAISNGSSYELETQVLVAERLSFISKEKSDALCEKLDEIQKMNYNLQRSLSDKH
ncbi:MAG: four helix bundle protein [Bacteroidetes bacterium]|nr:four helix bundle protein [Bacteroidota bacterium]